MIPQQTKRRKFNCDTNNNNGNCEEDVKEDRLSALPDAIIINILSHLRINTVIATSILSRRWNSLWRQMIAIRVIRTSYLYRKDFFRTINRILERLTSNTINTFEFDEHILPSYEIFAKLMHHVCARQVKQIRISVDEYYSAYTIPPCVLQSQSLEILELVGCAHFELPHTGIDLPNLKKLSFSGCGQYNLHLLENLHKFCPLLQILHFSPSWIKPTDDIIKISASNLKLLNIVSRGENKNDSTISSHPGKKASKLVIDAPTLQHFSFESTACLIHCFETTPSALSTAYMSLGYLWNGPDYNPCRALDVLEPLHNVRFLNVRADKLLDNIVHHDALDIPVFYHLTILKLWYVHYSPGCWKNFLCFTKYCPELQVLFVKFGVSRQNMNDKIGSRTKLNVKQPGCLLIKVKEITLELPREGSEHWVDHICYILRIAKVLETLNVIVFPYCRYSCRSLQLSEELDLCQKLCLFRQTHSLTCQINFDGHFLNVSREGMIIRACSTPLASLLARSDPGHIYNVSAEHGSRTTIR